MSDTVSVGGRHMNLPIHPKTFLFVPKVSRSSQNLPVCPKIFPFIPSIYIDYKLTEKKTDSCSTPSPSYQYFITYRTDYCKSSLSFYCTDQIPFSNFGEGGLSYAEAGWGFVIHLNKTILLLWVLQ